MIKLGLFTESGQHAVNAFAKGTTNTSKQFMKKVDERTAFHTACKTINGKTNIERIEEF